MSNSKKTVADIITIVNYAVGKMRRHWNISNSEADDLRQDGYLAAIRADKTYDPSKAAWSTWVLKRVNGELKDSIARLRNLGITSSNTYHVKQLLDVTNPMDRDGDDEELDNSIEELVAADTATDEAADTSSMMTTLSRCVSPKSKHILSLYYGLEDGSRSLSATQLADRLGYSRKHAFSLLQQAQQEARSCLGRSI